MTRLANLLRRKAAAQPADASSAKLESPAPAKTDTATQQGKSMAWFDVIAKELQFVPLAIVAAEQMMKGATGADKKNAVLQLAGVALSGVEAGVPGTAKTIDAIAPAISTLIDGTVALFKAKNLFGFGDKPASQPTTPAPASTAPTS